MGAKDTKVYMIVDTKKIDVNNVEQHVEFKDNRKNPNPSKDPVNFVSQIDAGQKVFWFGEPKQEAQDTIEIIEIERKGQDEPEFLESKSKDPAHRGAFMAKVINDYQKGTESYKIIFRIKGRTDQFKVDPKLEMKI